MDLTALESKLVPGAGGALAIDFSALESPGLWSSLAPYLGRSALALRGVEQPYARDGERLTVRGTGASAPFADMAVTVVFRAGGEPSAELTAEITATARTAWRMVDAFPALRGTIFADLSFVPFQGGPAVTLTLRAPDGMSVEGNGAPETFSGLGFIADGADHYPLRGSLEASLVEDPSFNPRGFPRDQANVVLPRLSLRCELPPGPGLSLPFTVEGVRCDLEAGPSYDLAFHAWRMDSEIWLSAELLWGRAPVIRIPVEARVDGPRLESVVLRARLGDVLAKSLRGLASLAGAELDSPIAGLSPDDPVDLASLELVLGVGRDRATLRRIRASIQTRDDLRWPLVEGFMTLDAIDLDFSIQDPFQDSARVRMQVTGLVGIGKTGTLELSAALERDGATGSWAPVFHGALVPGTVLSLADVFERFTGTRNPDLPGLELHSFELELAPAAKRASGLIELRDIWELRGGPVDVTFDNVLVSFERDGEAPASVRIDGAFAIGGTYVYLIADYEGVARGWTFSGSTIPEKPPVTGAKLDALLPAGVAPRLPAAVKGLQLTKLGVRFNTATKDFSFLGTVAFPFDAGPGVSSAAALTVHADLTHPPADAADQTPLASFGGNLHLAGRDFGVEYDRDLLVASYDGRQAGGVDLHDLLAPISGAAADLIPRGWTIGLERAQLALVKDAGDGSRALFAVELGAGVDLSKLPLVGSYFDPGQTLTVVLQLVIAGGRFLADEIRRINARTGPAATKLPEADVDPTARNIQVRTGLRLGGKHVPFGAPLAWPVPPAGAPPGPITAPPASGTPALWQPIQQAFGPFHFERVGIGLAPGARGLAILLDASLQLGALTLTLAGLGAEVSFADLGQGDLKPRFHLDGLGVNYESGDLRIGGALLRVPVPGKPEQLRFDGAVAVQYGDVGIVGVGSYVDDPLSFFIYALVDYPLGGPSFFFVEGVAFGFGYNYALTVPPLEHVSTFPLVDLAGKPKPDLTPAAVAGQLSTFLAPSEGEHFVAAGVRFNSFKVLEGALLVAVSFGRELALDVVGVAALVSPPPSAAPGTPSLVNAKLGIHARYRPDEGDLRVQGALMPGAYLFSEDCHLSGGFAFSAWFKDGGGAKAGDFVLTLGGYHAAFRPPAHYPKAPRLALNWRVNEKLSIKADAYFALTPSAIMAGGHLRGDYQDDDLHAWFTAGVDCLASWLPYGYQADLDISIGASYSTWCGTHTGDLTASLHVKGPPFSGTAHVNVWIISFDIDFESDGADGPPPPDLDWPRLRESQLPERVLTVSARAGKVAHHAKSADRPPNNQRDHLGVINPRELRLHVHSAIPVTGGAVLGTTLQHGAKDSRLGIAPLDRKTLKSEIGISIWRGTEDVSAAFVKEEKESQESLPAAIWGQKRKPALNRATATVNARTGFTLRPRTALLAGNALPGRPPEPALHTGSLKRPELGGRFAPVADGGAIAGRVQDPATRKARNEVLGGLLPGAESDWTGMTVEALRGAPRMVRP